MVFFVILFFGAGCFMPAFAADNSEGVYLQVTKEQPSVEIIPSPYASVQETLNFSGIDMQARGANGVQSDISIRGSNFEQPQIMVDGIRMNDPQTAHHNIDLPVLPQSISSIMVDRSRGGGVIEIKTGGEQNDFLKLGMLFGSNAAAGLNLNGFRKAGAAGYLFNISRTRSDGYFSQAANRSINDYDISNFFLKVFTGSAKRFSPRTIHAGYTAKAFGAYDFYTPYRNLPSRENTKTELVRADFEPYRDFSSSIYIRRHTDTFVIKDTAPDLYKNSHVSGVYGLLSKLSRGGKDAGFEGVFENIDSTGTKGGLGKHERTKLNVYGFYGFSFSGVSVKPGLKAEYNNFFNDVEFLPEISAVKNTGGKTEIHISANRFYRLPSFTELYYEDLVNKGDSSLKKESSWNYTLGSSFSNYGIMKKVSCDLFLRDESNIIDWLETAPGSRKYNAVNVGSVRRQGVELRGGFALRGGLHAFSAGYNYTENVLGDYSLSAKSSKYALRNPVNEVFSNLTFGLPFGIKNSWDAVYKDRKNEAPYTTVSAGFTKKSGSVEISAVISNIFDAVYEEILGVQQAGRRAELNINYQLF